jgi:putative ABC transport system substrate-binding protein
MSICLRRREFIGALGGAAAWPLAARAQQGDRVRRIGVLVGFDEHDPVAKTIVSAFTQALAGFGWTDGRNVRMDLRWAGPDINRMRALARELVGLQPDIIVTSPAAPTVALQRATRTIPHHRHRRAARPPEREHHRLRQLGSHAVTRVCALRV